jgi:Ribosomal L32p protein family.
MSTLSRMKAAVTSADPNESRPYECKTCGARFRLQQQVCPGCGGYTLDRIDWSS